MRNPSVMEHVFSQVPKAEIPRSTFDRSHGHKTTFDAGYLIPIYYDMALPGDTASVRMSGFCRLATPIFPVMDNLYMDTHFFSIPLRLVWSNWERFNGAQDDPGDSTSFIIPKVNFAAAGDIVANSVYDYFGLPVGVDLGDERVSALPFRAMNLCYREWFRDQNLQNSPTVLLDDGPDPVATYSLFRRAKRHDYFTSCLPWPQKGAGVSIPLGTSATVRTQATDLVSGAQAPLNMLHSGGGVPGANVVVGLSGQTLAEYNGAAGAITAGIYPSNLYADLTNATAATINSLRQAFQIQKIYERDARGGTRYVEQLKAHWGVTSPDFRLQRPEFLGGGSSPVSISPIPQTGGTGAGADTPQGNLAAMGTATLRNHGFTHSFTEHCIVLGFVSVRADLTYQQGLNRLWTLSTRFDFPLPALMHIGEQAVLSKEIFCDGTVDDQDVFGYQERFAEWRYKPSMITGEFRSSFAQSLDAWHLSQDFAARPLLDSAFIIENPPIDRVIAVTTEPHFIGDFYFSARWARPMPLFGVPGNIDRF